MAQPLTDEGGEETGVPGENARYKSSKIQAMSETPTRTIALVAGQEIKKEDNYDTIW